MGVDIGWRPRRIQGVAVPTLAAQTDPALVAVAVFASRREVPATQWPRRKVVVEADQAPTVWAMAVLANRPKLGHVRVRVAGLASPLRAGALLAMTGGAGLSRVTSMKLEAGRLMAESGAGEGASAHVMTGAAGAAQIAVAGFVAGSTRDVSRIAHGPPVLSAVARVAGHVSVHPAQVEAS